MNKFNFLRFVYFQNQFIKPHSYGLFCTRKFLIFGIFHYFCHYCIGTDNVSYIYVIHVNKNFFSSLHVISTSPKYSPVIIQFSVIVNVTGHNLTAELVHLVDHYKLALYRTDNKSTHNTAFRIGNIAESVLFSDQRDDFYKYNKSRNLLCMFEFCKKPKVFFFCFQINFTFTRIKKTKWSLPFLGYMNLL